MYIFIDFIQDFTCKIIVYTIISIFGIMDKE